MFTVVSVLIGFIVLMFLANDVLFERKRNKLLKILEFFACLIVIYFIFISIYGYVGNKEDVENTTNNSIFDRTIIIYNENDEIIEKTSVRDHLYYGLIKNIFNRNSDISDSEYLRNNIIIISVSVVLFVYWLVLLLLYEKEQVSSYKIVEDDILFERYNPMIAACIAQNRNVMTRDMVAVILNLIHKKKINIRIIPDETIKEVGYRYMLSENLESIARMDLIEKDIYDWIFEEIPNYKRGVRNVTFISTNEDGVTEIDLIKWLEELPENQDTYPKLKELNLNVKKRVNQLGANKESVPSILKMFNNILLIVALFLVSNHIMHSGMEMIVTSIQILYYMVILMFAIIILPILYTVSLIFLQFIYNFFKTSQEITEGYTGRKIIAKSISIIFATIVLMVICVIFAKGSFIMYDILLLGVTCLIIFTDDYMLKHEPKILNDYYNLKRIKNKISEYSMMEIENIEYLKVWDQYYAYAVAFGITMPVNEALEIPYSDTELFTAQNLEGIYYVCKSYLEIMWDVELYDIKSDEDIISIIDKMIEK